MGADAVRNGARHPHEHNFRGRDVIGVFQKLFDQLSPTFADAEGAVTAVTGM